MELNPSHAITAARKHLGCVRACFGALLVLLASSTQTYADFVQGRILVAHKTSGGSHVISELDANGNLIRQFGNESSDEFRAHLALAGGFLYRSNGAYLNTVSQFDDTGTLVRTILPSTSATHAIVPITSDFDHQSIYFRDAFAGSNVIHHLDDAVTGASTPLTVIQYPLISEVTDLYLGGPEGAEALYALTATDPSAGPYRAERIDRGGAIQFIDSPELTVQYITDIGSIAADGRNGDIFVATGSKIVRFDNAGNPLGSFAFVDFKPSLAVHTSGQLWIGRFDNGQISVVSPTGVPVKTISIPGAVSISDVLIVPSKTKTKKVK